MLKRKSIAGSLKTQCTSVTSRDQGSSRPAGVDFSSKNHRRHSAEEKKSWFIHSWDFAWQCSKGEFAL